MQRELKSVGIAICAAAINLWAQTPPKIMIAMQAPPVDQLINVGPPGAGAAGLTVQLITKDGEFTGQPVAGAPFSAHEVNESVQTLADGNRITRTTESQLYRDGQGRVRREVSLGPPPGSSSSQKHTIITIDDPVAGVTYSLEPEEHIARKLLRPTPQDDAAFRAKLKAENKAQAGEPANITFYKESKVQAGESANVTFYKIGSESGHQSATEDLGTQVIEGITAAGTRVTTTIPTGAIGNEQPIQIVSERWYAPDLQTVVLSKLNDPRIGETTHKLTNINRGEPDPSLFQVPAGYTVQDSKPGTLMRYNVK
jgi:hypothetical protein